LPGFQQELLSAAQDEITAAHRRDVSQTGQRYEFSAGNLRCALPCRIVNGIGDLNLM
jgi:hypothetical protein